MNLCYNELGFKKERRMKKMIAVIDYGAGNLQSVVKALNYIGCESIVTDKKEDILKADGAILPGVGSFADAMSCMQRSGADKAVLEFVECGKPFLGICLGLQLLFDGSEESPGVQGLGLLKGSITKIPNQNNTLKIPHMGWNSLDILTNDGIFRGIPQHSYVYFVHSYYLKADSENIVAARTTYGTDIDVSVQYKNIFATQFHPEKSGHVGLQILRNFADIAKGGFNS